MKKVILSIITLVVVAFGISNFSYAAPVNNVAATTLTDIRTINKIEVRGNVTLYISDAKNDQVKVYNKYYSESALVQSSNGTLRISSYSPERLIVWVSADDLRSVTAFDNAEIKSFGKLSAIDFNVVLHDAASAKLNLDAFNANVIVKDHARVDLTGDADQLNLVRNYASSVNSFGFQAAHYSEDKIDSPADAVKSDMLSI